MLKALNRPPNFHWAASGGLVEGLWTRRFMRYGPRALAAYAFSYNAAGSRTKASSPGTKLPSYYLQSKAPPNSITLSGGAVT